MADKWTSEDIPNVSGKIFIITGANSGLGYESALALLKKNATVIMACRNLEKANAALEQIKQQVPNADAVIIELDLANLASIKQFVGEYQTRYDTLDVLMNNAGILGIPYQETVDGFETQFGVNHLGHFALTGHLLEILLDTAGSRIVNVSSSLHRGGKMNWDDLQMKQQYNSIFAYNNSKLANILFTRALHKRLQGKNTITVACHPGFAGTNLQIQSGNLLQDAFMRYFGNPIFGQSAAHGAWSQLYAATMPHIEAGAYYGPHLFQMRGYPEKQLPVPRARRDADAERLWEISVQLTGVNYRALNS